VYLDNLSLYKFGTCVISLVLLFVCVCVCVCLGNVFSLFFPLLTYRHRGCYFVCATAIGGQHDGDLPFWLPDFVKLIMLKLYVLSALLN